MKLIYRVTSPERLENRVDVRFNSTTREYVVQLFRQDIHYRPADYFTDSREDAIGTANVMCKETPK